MFIDKKNKSKDKLYRYTLSRQMTGGYVVILALTIIICVIINRLQLEGFYIKNKQNSMLEVYARICEAVEEDSISDERFSLEMQHFIGKYNVSIVIISSTFELIEVFSNERETEILHELQNNLRGIDTISSVMVQNEKYVMVTKPDMRTNIDYIEMWGVLPDDSFFLMRSALESIEESTSIANKFLIYIGFVSVVVSALFIFLLSRRYAKPVLELANISEKMAGMDFEAKYTGKDKNEIGLLGNNINSLSSSLEATINELKSANEELTKDNELKTQIDEMRKEFISNVSHEFKTPIALIQGYAEGLKEEINEAEERDYYCDVIMDEASKMNILVKKLLNLTQLEFGNISINCEKFDICSLIKNFTQSAEILTKRSDIKLLLPEDEIFVFADEFFIEEVFNNYFSNAINHCEGETKYIDVSIQKNENTIRVLVENSGNQIPEDSLNVIWDKFYKIDKARTRAYGGSGIGLSIVKAIMELHNQKYGVFNTENGVCFWFDLQKA